MGVLGALTAAPAAAYRTLADVEGSAAPIVWQEPAGVAFLPHAGMSAAERALVEAELAAAIQVWGSLSCSAPMLRSSRRDAATVHIGFVDDWAARGLAPDAAGATDLALTTRPDGSVAITGAAVHLNTAFEWGAHPQEGLGGFRDLRALLVHELGHVLGLAHPCELEEPALSCTPDDEETTMHPIYRGPEQATLSTDDVAGVCALYPALGAALVDPVEEAHRCAGDEDCATGRWCVEGKCERDLRFGSDCERPSTCLGDRCLAGLGGGTCTYVCAADDECPAGTRCARVGGADERVCAPRSATCSASPGGSGTAPWGLLGLPLLLCLRRRRAPAALLAVGLLAGCGGEMPGLDAGPGDAGERVDAAEALDAGALDGAPRDAAGSDAGVDAGPERCDSPGATRLAPCGFCGMGSEECTATGHWELISACLGQGECRAGEVEREDLGLCGEQQRICLTTCEWTPWETTAPSDGECTPGDLRRHEASCAAGLAEEQRCDDRCRWETTSACSDPCGGTARTSPMEQEEVCIPGGPFVRGSERSLFATPIAEVHVSSFYIDRYPVTNDRYRACVDAGHCFRPTGTANVRSYDTPTRGRYPFQGAPHPWAARFCAWDGGRRLPTEAEWEKAARGPAPRAPHYLWDGDEFRCDLIPGGNCPGSPSLAANTAAFAIDALPGARSYYGTYLQLGGAFEWTADYFDRDYYADPASLVDPQGPPPPASGSLLYVLRGAPADRLPSVRLDLAYPLGVPSRERRTAGDVLDAPVGIRCARSVP
ncbi:MAG: SUMF1/EgtB/PvdO family nonheme iron enzyme [Sandaracinaceae bacterium]|nr:SUMF1/EgtB/PvdO family nonheme iron enzyme [Sandaracinaceae bacterium]